MSPPATTGSGLAETGVDGPVLTWAAVIGFLMIAAGAALARTRRSH